MTNEALQLEVAIASTALLQYEIDVPLCEMAEIIGEDNAVSAYRASLASIADIEKVLKETGVDADFEKRPSLFYASIPKDIELIEKEYVIRKKHNLPVRLLGKEEIKKLYNIEVPGNALLNRVSGADGCLQSDYWSFALPYEKRWTGNFYSYRCNRMC